MISVLLIFFSLFFSLKNCPLPLSITIAHRPLPVGCCLSAIAHLPFPISRCPLVVAHRPLPVSYCRCPSAIARRPLPVGRCPSAVAHRPLPICHRWNTGQFFSSCLLSEFFYGDGTVRHFLLHNIYHRRCPSVTICKK